MKPTVLLLDGALGTELERRGVPTPLPLWSAAALLTHPEAVREIHREYAEAGADVITTCTFRTTARDFAKAGKNAKEAEEATRLAVRLAREAVQDVQVGARHAVPLQPVAVAGSLAPLEDCYRPALAPDFGTCLAEHDEQARILADCGADLLLAETLGTVREAVAAARACRKTGLPVWVSLIPGPNGTLLDGTPFAQAVAQTAAEKPDAILANCFPAAYGADLAPFLKSTGIPFGLYANSSTTPGAIWQPTDAIGPEDYLACAKTWMAAGGSIVGGCCGTGPEHIRNIKANCLIAPFPHPTIPAMLGAGVRRP